jgi:very-short-patch-repair endonuclease
MVDKVDRADGALARIAVRQHGVVTAKQLSALGMSREAVRKRVQRGRLHRLHRGVYAVGHAAPSEARAFMAAVKACGEGAALSHFSAAVLWKFLMPEGGPVHVTSPSMAGKVSQRGIVLHRSPSLRKKGMVRQRYWIPVTSPQRTIEDLEGTVEPRLYRRAKSQAEFLRHRLNLPTDRTRSDLERDFLALFNQHGFPPAEVNVKVGKHRVDFLWRAEKLVVETDFFDYHRGSVAFNDDHQRDLELRLADYTVRRYTGDQLDDYPDQIVKEIGEILSAV